MTLHTFSDGSKLLKMSKKEMCTRIHKMNMLVVYKDDTIQIFNSIFKNDNFLMVKLVGFNVNTGKDELTESDIDQLEIIHEASKLFYDELANLPRMYKYTKNCKLFGNISVDVSVYNGNIMVYNNDNLVFQVCHNRGNDIDERVSQQECEDAIMELVNKLVIYYPTAK